MTTENGDDPWQSTGALTLTGNVIADAYTQVARQYDQTYTDPRSQTEDAVLSRALERSIEWGRGSVSRTRRRRIRILDVGCGTGLFLKLIDGRRHPRLDYLGVDISAGMLAEHKRKWPDMRCRRMDFDAPWPGAIPDSYDLIVSLYGALSYSTKPEAAISHILSHLKPGGRFFLMLYGPSHSGRAAHFGTSGPALGRTYTINAAIGLLKPSRTLISDKRVWVDGLAGQADHLIIRGKTRMIGEQE